MIESTAICTNQVVDVVAEDLGREVRSWILDTHVDIWNSIRETIQWT